MGDNLLDEFEGLYEAYSRGLYTDAEIISRSLELLGEGDTALWGAFPAHIRDEVRKQIESYSEGDEVVLFSSEDVASHKRRMSVLKDWLVAHT